MPSVNVSQSVSGGGMNVAPTPSVVTCENVGPYEFSVSAGQAGSLSTRTDDNTGEITMSSGGHTIQTGDTVDIHWRSGGVNYCQRTVTVGTVSGTAVPISSGTGENLPAQDTAVVVSVQSSKNVTVDASGLQVLGIIFEDPTGAHVEGVQLVFNSASPAEVYALLTARNELTLHNIAGGGANPFSTTDIATMTFSNGSTVAGTLRVLVGQDV